MLTVVKVTYNHDNNNTTHSIPGGVGLKFGIVRELASVPFLCLHALVETNISDRDPEPSQETRNGRQAGEPAENLARTFRDTHKTKERKA